MKLEIEDCAARQNNRKVKSEVKMEPVKGDNILYQSNPRLSLMIRICYKLRYRQQHFALTDLLRIENKRLARGTFE